MNRYILTIKCILIIIVIINKADACVNETPVAGIYDSVPECEVVGETVYFNGYNDSYDPDDGYGYGQGISEWYWEIWSDTSCIAYSTDISPDYIFYTPGHYYVYLWVKDNDYTWSNYDMTEIEIFGINIENYYYLKPTPTGSGTDQVESPIVKYGDKLYFKFKIKIYPSGIEGVKLHKTKVALSNGSSDIASETHTYSGRYNEVTEVSGTTYMPHLTIPSTIVDGSEYSFRIDVDIDNNGSILHCIGVSATPVYANAQAVEIGQTISGEDNTSDDSRAAVANTILNRWNFPVISSGHAFARDSALRHNQTTIYGLAKDTSVFNTPGASLSNTVQNAREWGQYILDHPDSANGNGPIYFYQVGSPSTIVDDLVAVSLLTNSATYGNKYFSPSSDPSAWNTDTIKAGYDADSSDSLHW